MKEVIWVFGRDSQHVVLEQWWQTHSCLWLMNTLRKVENQNENTFRYDSITMTLNTIFLIYLIS